MPHAVSSTRRGGRVGRIGRGGLVGEVPAADGHYHSPQRRRAHARGRVAEENPGAAVTPP